MLYGWNKLKESLVHECVEFERFPTPSGLQKVEKRDVVKVDLPSKFRPAEQRRAEEKMKTQNRGKSGGNKNISFFFFERTK
jgi:hypothetical protein